VSYAFDLDRLEEIARKMIAVPRTELSRRLMDALAHAFPGHVSTEENWVFNIAAGSTGIMNVLHGSFTEYLILFGTPIGTEAYSGRYDMDIHDWVLSGEMQTYSDDNPLEPIITRPGEHAVLKRGRTKGFKLEGNTWMLEYGRGFVPSSLPTALSDTLIGALDFRTVAKTFWIYGKLMARELMQGKL
jgi:hypothetical protein